MLRLSRVVLLLCTLVLSMSSMLSFGAQNNLVADAEKAVDAYIGGLLQTMKQIQPLFTSDRAAYFEKVEQELTAFVDFKEVARGVMAKYGAGPQGATEEQLQKFSDVFRESLVDFYGSALASYGGVAYEILPTTPAPTDPANATNVRMNIKANDGSRFEIQYTMFLTAENVWKLKNLYVEGVNLRRQYFAQFDSLMMSNNYDIDKVIALWSVSQ